MSREVDYRQELIDKVTPLMQETGLRTVGGDVLLAIFCRNGYKSAGGVIVPTGYTEDRWQGVVCLVVGIGPLCCEERSPGYNDWFGGNPPQLHDWVGISVRDNGITYLLDDVPIRQVEWKYLRFLCDVPDLTM